MLQGRHGPEKGIHSPLRPSAQEPSWGRRSPFLLRTTHLPGGLRDVLPHLSRGSHMPSHLPSTHHYMSAPAVNTHRHRHVEHTQAHAHTQTQGHTDTHRCTRMCAHTHTLPLLHGAAVCVLLLSHPTPLPGTHPVTHLFAQD